MEKREREILIDQLGDRYRSNARKYYEYASTPREYLPGHAMYMREVDLLQVLGGGRDGRRSMGELASRLSVTQGAVTQIANRLLRKGMIRKYQSGADHRKYLVEATPLGEEVRRAHTDYRQRLHRELERRVFQRLDRQQLEFLIWYERAVGEVFDVLLQGEEPISAE